MITKKLRKVAKSAYKTLLHKEEFKPVRYKVRFIKRRSIKLANMELSTAMFKSFKFSKRQFRIRPRMRLLSKVIPVLVIFYLVSVPAVAYIKPKEAQIKINGRPVVVSEELPPVTAIPTIESVVQANLSPFDFRSPVQGGNISQGYSAYHRADDIAAPFNTPIHPLGPGVVEFAGFLPDGKGNVVVVDHGDGIKTSYAHMNKILVGVGNAVLPTATIGTIGLTGRTTGPHVHLELFNDNVAVDPRGILPPRL